MKSQSSGPILPKPAESKAPAEFLRHLTQSIKVRGLQGDAESVNGIWGGSGGLERIRPDKSHDQFIGHF
jgi:hypothetical protein